VLAATLDIPVRAKRVRDLRNGLAMPYRPTLRRVVEAALAPPWSLAVLRRGLPRFANIERYAGTDDRAAVATFVQRNVGGGFDWDTLARLRDAWPRAMMVKGVLHPADAERAVALGIDGILVSNHGGRQFDAAPASIDVLPAIRAAVGSRATVMLDSGIRSGLDAVRAVACGTDGTLSGRAFLLALAALGDAGAAHLATALVDEVRTAMAQAGATDLAAVRTLAQRHPGAWKAEAFGTIAS
jgi:L-lactate dehydrogenase (cytochrome)